MFSIYIHFIAFNGKQEDIEKFEETSQQLEQSKSIVVKQSHPPAGALFDEVSATSSSSSINGTIGTIGLAVLRRCFFS